MSSEHVITALIGLCSGVLVAAGLFAFITTLGIVLRLAQATHTANYLHMYENCVVGGAILGSIIYCYPICFYIGNAGTLAFGVFSGVFTGCLIGSVAEVLNGFPILFRRLRLHQGVTWIVAALAFGKFIGVLIQYFGAL